MRFLIPTLLSFLLLSIGDAVFASPRSLARDTGKATLAISIKVNTAGAGNVVVRDRARVQLVKNSLLPTAGAFSSLVNISNAVIFYLAEVGVGTPPAYRTLLVDTGSSNTWIGATQPYVPTNSSVDTHNSVSVTYGSGAFFGEEWLDTVTLAPGLEVIQQSIGVAQLTEGIRGFDGILGLGPVDLTWDTLNDTFQVPTVPDNLYAQKKISEEVLGVFLVPASLSNDNGTLTFGGYDESATTSAVEYVPLTTTDPAAQYWGFNQSISYGNTRILAPTAGFVDSGTTLILIASDAFNRYADLTGATVDSTTGLLTITSAQYASLQTLWFDIGGRSYGLTPNAQIWPRSLNAAIGGRSGVIYLVVTDIGYPSGSGLDFVNGYSFLQRFYSVYDTTNKRLGFAHTAHTDAETN